MEEMMAQEKFVKKIENLRYNKATIKDVELVKLEPHVDDRGYLIEIIRAVDPFGKFF
jgi:dTDP-4-dehydrorhamnose 3,5-epimerase-like enzyme